MKFVIQRTKRKKTEHGFVFNEKPQMLVVCGKLQKGSNPLITVPFGKHYSQCEVKDNPCLDNALTYEEGEHTEICCEGCK